MWRVLGLTGISVLISGLATGQVKKQFTIEDKSACQVISLHIKANNGNCYIKPSHNQEILTVFGNQEASSYNHQFKEEIKGKSCNVFLSLEDSENKGVSYSLTTKVFSSDAATDKFWKMYLTDEKPYHLELTYGLGNANVDLSGLSIKTLKINTASADVVVGYQPGIENLVQMDTLTMKVDVGSVNAKNISLAKTRYILADVGLGNVTLDFSTQPTVGNIVKGSVGAGNLIVLLPKGHDTPVSVKIKDSWLCSTKLPSNFKKTGSDTYANSAYLKNPANALTFDLDVSMGNIVFKQGH
ncbi:MAG: hypothetical protein OEU76_02685 [Cyclobacteriaceae bacterium]|nr:hypothetical protein [Cyclobacteriaceae bacterium]